MRDAKETKLAHLGELVSKETNSSCKNCPSCDCPNNFCLGARGWVGDQIFLNLRYMSISLKLNIMVMQKPCKDDGGSGMVWVVVCCFSGKARTLHLKYFFKWSKKPLCIY